MRLHRGGFLILLALAFPAGSAGGPRNEPLWSPDHAAHLLRRAGFGGTPEQVEQLASLGRAAAVESLVNYERIPALRETFEPASHDLPSRAELRAMSDDERQKLVMDRRRAENAQLERMRGAWVRRMAETPRPLEEKMVLFWHGHFTSGMREVKSSRLLWHQNELFRRHATGNFRTLLVEVSRDPAMILYLNNAQNVKGHPNENYARELMELFTLGIGHYTERDVLEAARAFTGWGIERESGEFVFRARQHDDGVKIFLGERGPWNGGDVIDIILKKPRAAEYITERLWRFFAGTEPDPQVIRPLAAVLRKNKYELKPLLRAIFMHDQFYAERVMFVKIKSPVELVVGLCRALEIRPVDRAGVAFGLRMMGQDLFQPPNVKGWDGGLNWINTATLFNRYNVVARLLSGSEGPRRRRWERMRERTRDDLAEMEPADDDGPQPPYDPMPLVSRRKLTTPEAVVDDFVDRLLQRRIEASRREVLISTFRQSLRDSAVLASPANAEAVRELLLLIVAMPEYQVW
ncbi:MAG: DUF1800 domain-containing protein [Phycisphaerae bacterium]|nr:DUF1800 domain-containing protein [Phycisphaerae bacterium]